MTQTMTEIMMQARKMTSNKIQRLTSTIWKSEDLGVPLKKDENKVDEIKPRIQLENSHPSIRFCQF